ncbi:hypothetical protein [Hyalangium rubrum]|uniref:Lipoprotein n=1 Tax=Hyalangium rubrum TaxID=3103134 RepID=A0ABU5HGK1_9BACT|nr:hypothetical protein [Hyalangium sp. s54d21]MDY7231220.1 hypothetical protein [Hyalangium sp. s54d21]
MRYGPLLGLLALLLAPATWAAEGPRTVLVKGRKYLFITDGSQPPKLSAYSSKDLKGTPAFVLDGQGLSFQGRKLCGWPGGSFDASKSYNMVLGYEDAERGRYVGCGEGLPFLSTWGDGGTGTAVLYIEVARVHPKSYELSYQGKAYYLPKTAIPPSTQLIDGAKVQSAGD